MAGMTTKQITEMVRSIGIPSAYHHFKEGSGREPPFITYYYPSSNNFHADDVNYGTVNALNIELYTDEKDMELEAAVEAVLKAHGIPFDWTETYIESERMYMKAYYTEVYINEQ